MLTIIDVIIVVCVIGLFYLLNLTGILPIVLCIGVGVLLHFVFASVLQVIKKKAEEEQLIHDQENRIQNVIQKFTGISIDDDGTIEDFVDSMSDFERKKKVLLEISNDAFVRNEVSDAEDYLVRLSERLEIKLKILKAVDRYDIAYNDVIEDIKTIVSTTKDYVDEVGNFLVQVGRSKDDDDDDEKKRKLSKSTDRMKEIKEQSKALFEEDPNEGFFVTTSSGSQFRI